MIITITDPGWDWTPLVTVGVVVLCVLVATTALSLMLDSEGLFFGGLLLAFVVFGIGGGTALGGSVDLYENAVVERQVQALEAEGFDDVTFDGDQFVANVDGEYYRGALLELEPLKYQIVEVAE